MPAGEPTTGGKLLRMNKRRLWMHGESLVTSLSGCIDRRTQ